MKQLVTKEQLRKIIDSDYPTDVKVESIAALWEQDRINTINELDNEIAKLIDKMK